MPFEVIGDELELAGVNEDLDGVEGVDVLGADVLGYEGPMGYEVQGEEPDVVVGADGRSYLVVGARPHARRVVRHARGARTVGKAIPIQAPAWRGRQLAPGVIAPDQGLLPLPLHGQGGTDTFTAALGNITFEGQIQKPFRGERLLVSTIRTGASAVGRLISQLFVGTDLQQLDVAGFDAEQVGAVTAFGVRLTMKPAQPGVFIRLVTNLNVPLVAADTIVTTVTLLGRNVH